VPRVTHKTNKTFRPALGLLIIRQQYFQMTRLRHIATQQARKARQLGAAKIQTVDGMVQRGNQ